MRVLVVGFSRIVQRKVMPALSSMATVESVDIASRRAAEISAVDHAKVSQVYDSYETALASTSAELVYISTVNSEHAQWAECALRSGKHVVIDKPATDSLERTQHLIAMARDAERCIAEAVVYPFHPLVTKTLELLASLELQPIHLASCFSFPALDPQNFRYRPELGGGALLDLGAYTVSPGRLFFGGVPESVSCEITARSDVPNGVETGFTTMMTYSGGRTLTGHYDFNAEYRNQLALLGRGVFVELNRVFTPPPDQPMPIQLICRNKSELVQTDASDCFASFLDAVIQSSLSGDFNRWSDDMLTDARTFDMLRNSAKE